ncbi:type VI immunity family protein [Pseudomonas vanderleydeniana]|uniref:DUF3396 domain-containing protein n=1 Tax=Pseudomonas vanderleydeniana TaxID=2745495 RepID=A0A9E6PPD3_9PSED|nr:type VI immunity family protein [Pseudomonas vanderleydeniana]QXI30123.1 DUF3396 domain-containing protein [Pseudomonas vanderleydeniana]
MSTTHEVFTEKSLEGFVTLLKEWPNSAWGNVDAEYSVSPFISFYFPADMENHAEISLRMVDIHEEFEQLIGAPYTIAIDSEAARPYRYPRRRPDLRAQARRTSSSDYFVFSFTDEENHATSPTHAGYFWRSWIETDDDLKTAYSSIVFYYRWQWWLDNRDAWRRFVLKTIDLLGAHQVYSGFAMANPLEFGTRGAVSAWERSLTPHFYGLDIEYAYSMDDELLKGIRPPTWAFLLSDHWREKLDLTREQVREALDHPGIGITELRSGQWIELGEQPELYPAKSGVPKLPRILNQLLKPIRNDDLGLLGFGQWDGDPNERFTDADSRRWLARFDADSDWPTPTTRWLPFHPLPSDPVPAKRLPSAASGTPCLQDGWWFVAHRPYSRQAFKQGETLPALPAESGDEQVIWQLDTDQTPSRHASSGEPAPREGRWELESDPYTECTRQLNAPLPYHEYRAVRWRWTEGGTRARSGELCPWPGTWTCEYRPGNDQYLEYKDPMPTIDGDKVLWVWVDLKNIIT